MNWLVELMLVLKRISLIFIGRTFLTFWAVVSDCVPPVMGFFHSALPIRKPAPVFADAMTLKVVLTLTPGATGVVNVFEVSTASEITEVHPLGKEMLNLTSVTVTPVVFVNVSVMSCVELCVNVVARDSLIRCTSYFAATILACTASVVASVGYPVVITPS